MYHLGLFIAALIPTFIISRLLLFVTRSWQGGIRRLLTVHAFSWLIAAFIAGGLGDGGAFAEGVKYLVPQLAWLLVDVIRARQKNPSENVQQNRAASSPPTPPTDYRQLRSVAPVARTRVATWTWLKRIGVSLAVFAVAYVVVKYAVQSGIQWTRDNTPGLTEETRTAFINSAVRTCFSAQRGYPQNRSLSDETLSHFCKCYAGWHG
jgi:hypothetical protein